MSGTPNGIIDVFESSVNQTVEVVTLFNDMIAALDAASNVDQISRRDDAALENRFVVYRFNATAERTWDWYLYIGAAQSGNTHDGPEPFQTGQSYIVAQCARGIGGDGNPWLGTTNADGTDTKPAAPWWGIPSGGTNVQVLPAENSPYYQQGFSPYNDLEAGINVIYFGSGGTLDFRHSVVVDDDSIAVVVAPARSSSNSYHMWFATWVHPNDVDDVDGGTLYTEYNTGSINTAGAQNSHACGAFDLDTSPGSQGAVRATGVIPNSISGGLATDHPNTIAGDVYEEYSMGVMAEGNDRGHGGFLGIADPSFLGCVCQVSPEDSNTGLTRAFFGNGTATQFQLVIPWDGSTTPGTHGTNSGVTF